MTELNIAVVGLGLGRHFVAACAEAPQVERVTGCDPDEERRAAVRDSVAAAYADLDALLETERPDAVCVVTPDHMHRAHAERCFEAGCHVLLTKPLACNLEDGRAIVRAADAARRRLMVAHERRFRSDTKAAKTILDSGDLGEVIHLRVDAIQYKRGQFQRAPWYASAEAGRSAIVGTGVHEVDLVRHLVGRDIVSVAAFGNRLGALPFPKDKTTAALFQFEGGAIGQVTVTYEGQPQKGRHGAGDLLLIASRGMIAGNRVGRAAGEAWEALPRDPDPLAAGVTGCVEGFVRALSEGTPVPVSGLDAFASLAACVAADRSAASGTVVKPARFESSVERQRQIERIERIESIESIDSVGPEQSAMEAKR
ncbi:MAG: Gfo/Idh/MocA family oxidoreductase [Kiritimatiellae bacterium]|nr:Gfo/Idh/MocA family oxidoreductase [Kiritimatiellia bacterium]